MYSLTTVMQPHPQTLALVLSSACMTTPRAGILYGHRTILARESMGIVIRAPEKTSARESADAVVHVIRHRVHKVT